MGFPVPVSFPATTAEAAMSLFFSGNYTAAVSPSHNQYIYFSPPLFYFLLCFDLHSIESYLPLYSIFLNRIWVSLTRSKERSTLDQFFFLSSLNRSFALIALLGICFYERSVNNNKQTNIFFFDKQPLTLQTRLHTHTHTYIYIYIYIYQMKGCF